VTHIVCDIKTPILQLYTFLFVYKNDFNSYAIFIAKYRGKILAKKIPGKNSLPLFLGGPTLFMTITGKP
jgi:hypothetical protein